ncbi:hypothetical protein, partial [Escherichia coli]|uniref:hypothetical protein n=1 Tax=Escherichia coli TaxID=562 RepID=UPI001B8BE75A
RTSGEKRVFLVILFTSFSGSLVSRIPGAVQINSIHPYREQKRNADEQLMVAGTNAFFPARNDT